MKNRYLNSLSWLVMGLLVSFTAGCTTPTPTSGWAGPALWHDTEKRTWRPSSIDQILLLTDTNQQRQLIVLFTQARERDNKTITQKVGWRIGQAPDQVATTPDAIRRLTNQVDDVQPLPILLPMEVVSNAPGRPACFAVVGYPPTYFWVYTNGQPSKAYSLPTTTQTFYMARTCFYPVAVATDAAIVSAAAVTVAAGAVAIVAGHGSIEFHP